MARASLSSLDDVTITCAPISRASCSAKIETPPVPCTSTVWPGDDAGMLGERVPRRDRRARQGRAFLERQVGRQLDHAVLLEHRVVAQHAVDAAAERAGMGVGGGAPPTQRWKKQPATRSPTLTRVTSGPTSTTSPAPSDSGMRFGLVGIR